MGRSKTRGLICRNGVWHIQKRIKGYGRLCESTGSRDYGEAERYLIFRINQVRDACVYGVRPARIFREAGEYHGGIRYIGPFRLRGEKAIVHSPELARRATCAHRCFRCQP